MAKIRITHLRLRTMIGTHPRERRARQEVVAEIAIDYDAARAVKTDCLEYALDYEAITKKIAREVKDCRFFLLETLAQRILEMVMEEPSVCGAWVRVDKPRALRRADSVAVEVSRRRNPRGAKRE